MEKNYVNREREQERKYIACKGERTYKHYNGWYKEGAFEILKNMKQLCGISS